jgi:hypothetical protein
MEDNGGTKNKGKQMKEGKGSGVRVKEKAVLLWDTIALSFAS